MIRLKALKEEDGFTLIEMTVVLLIMAVLAMIVVFAVQISPTLAEKNAAIADAKAITVAINRYNVESRKSEWPEESLGLNVVAHTIDHKGAAVDGSTTSTVNTGSSASSPKLVLTDTALANYTQIDWDADTEVRRDTGHLTFKFIDDYLLSLPPSTQWKRDGTSNYEYLFLLKKTNQAEGRIVELYQLNTDSTSWEKIFP